MTERDKEIWGKSQQWDSSDDGRGKLKILESVEKFADLIREDERKEIRAQMTRLVIVPTLTHGTLVKLTDVDAAIRARGNT